MPAGRPRLIKSPEEMLTRGEAFFEACKADDQPITITGLALELGLSGREALGEYGRREEFSDTVKKLKSVCENFCERRALASNSAGAIFALKNYGWSDAIRAELSGADGGPIQSAITVEFVKTKNINAHSKD